MTAAPNAGLPTGRVLTIAGSDSGGGAGIQADLKTMLAHGVHGMSVLTAVTAQNSLGVQGVWPLPTEAIRAQFRSVVDDIGVDAVKTGMSGTVGVTDLVAELLAELLTELVDPPAGDPREARRAVPIVVDPVCASKHGDPLIEPAAITALAERLVPLATVLTPNLPEAALLSGLAESAPAPELAAALLDRGATWVVIKGGHAAGDPVDHLFGPAGAAYSFGGERSDNRHSHGTGCSLASAIASRLALGDEVPEAVRRAKAYVAGAIAGGFELGSGIGPTDHAWWMRDTITERLRGV